MIKRIIALMLVFMLCLSPMAFAADREAEPFEVEVALDAANFPDTAFRTLVSGFDLDSSGGLSGAEIAAVTAIDCRSSGVSDLTGLGHFTGLTMLNCAGCGLTGLELRRCTGLTSLDCGGNSLSALDLSPCPALTALRLTISPVPDGSALIYSDGVSYLRVDNGLVPNAGGATATETGEPTQQNTAAFSVMLPGAAESSTVTLSGPAENSEASQLGTVALTQISARNTLVSDAVNAAGENAARVARVEVALTALPKQTDAENKVLYDVQPEATAYAADGETLAVIPVGNDRLSGAFAISLLAPEGAAAVKVTHRWNAYPGADGQTVEAGSEVFEEVPVENGRFSVSLSHFSEVEAEEAEIAYGTISSMTAYFADSLEFRIFVSNIREGITPFFQVLLNDKTDAPVLEQKTNYADYASSNAATYMVVWDSARSRWEIRIKVFAKWIPSQFTVRMYDGSVSDTPLLLKGYDYPGVFVGENKTEHSYSLLDYLNVMRVYYQKAYPNNPKYENLYNALSLYGSVLSGW